MTNSNPPGRDPTTAQAGNADDTPPGAAEPTLGRSGSHDTDDVVDYATEGTGITVDQLPDPTSPERMPPDAESQAAVGADDSIEPAAPYGKLDYEPASPTMGEAEARDRREMAADLEPDDEEDLEPEQEKRGGGGALVWIVVILLALGVGGYFTWSSWSPMVAEYIPESIRSQSWFPAIPGEAPETAAVEEQGAEVDTPADGQPTEAPTDQPDQPEQPSDAAPTTEQPGSAATEPTAPGTATPAGQPDMMSAALTALSTSVENATQRLQGIETGLADLATQTEQKTAALGERLGGIEARSREVEQVTITVLAINNLEAAAAAGQDFASQLETVKTVAGDDPAIGEALATLEAQAGGVPTIGALKRSFPEVRDEIVRTNAGGEEGDWVDRMVGRLQGLYTYHGPGEGDPEAEGIEGTVARAEQALADNDIAAAVSALQGLEGPPAALDWLSAARGRVTVDESIARVRQDALARLTSKTGS